MAQIAQINLLCLAFELWYCRNSLVSVSCNTNHVLLPWCFAAAARVGVYQIWGYTGEGHTLLSAPMLQTIESESRCTLSLLYARNHLAVSVRTVVRRVSMSTNDQRHAVEVEVEVEVDRVCLNRSGLEGCPVTRYRVRRTN
jgi:hypothetical protein